MPFRNIDLTQLPLAVFQFLFGVLQLLFRRLFLFLVFRPALFQLLFSGRKLGFPLLQDFFRFQKGLFPFVQLFPALLQLGRSAVQLSLGTVQRLFCGIEPSLGGRQFLFRRLQLRFIFSLLLLEFRPSRFQLLFAFLKGCLLYTSLANIILYR